jgi:hypothetical protein
MRIGCDIDGVLADFIGQFLTEYINPQFLKPWMVNQGKPLTEDDIHTFDLKDSVPINPEVISVLFNRATEQGIYTRLPMYKNGLREIFQELDMRGHEIKYLTTRPSGAIWQTYEWLHDNKFPMNGGVYFSDEKHGGKAHLAKMLSLDVHIEDNVSNAVSVARVIPQVILYARPWNEYARTDRQNKLPDNIQVISGGEALIPVLSHYRGTR